MRRYLCVMVFLMCFFSNGVLRGSSAASLHIEKTFTTTDGLVSDNVLSILEDRDGVMWFGTTEGVSRYDGKDFQTFTTQDGLAENVVGIIFQDSHGRIWFGTGLLGNVSTRQRVVDMSLVVMPLRELAELPLDEIPESLRDPIPPKGVSCYDADGLRTFTTVDGLADNTVTDFFQDRSGRLWLATASGVSRYEGGTFDTLQIQGPTGMWVLPEYWQDVTAIAQDTAGNFWFASTAGIIYYNVKRSALRYFDDMLMTFQENSEGGTGLLTDLAFDAVGNLWMSLGTMGTESSGIRRYDGKAVVDFPQSQALPMNSVYNITKDRNGNLWFAGVKQQPPTMKETPDSLTMASPETGVGVSVYNGQTFENFDTDDGLPSDRVWAVFHDSTGNLWFATDAGVAVGVYLPAKKLDPTRRNRND